MSLEGSVLVERKDANEKLYNSKITARQLLEGSVRPPPAAEPLMRVLNSRVFAGTPSSYGPSMYNDIPIYDERHDDVVWEGRRGDAYGVGVRRDRTGSTNSRDNYEYRDKPKRATTWADDVYDRPPGGVNRSLTTRTPENNHTQGSGRNRSATGPGTIGDDYVYSDRKPTRPTAPKPVFGQKTASPALAKDEAVALFAFDADQDGDLGFKKGEIITIVKRTDKAEDWWTGRIGNRTGMFPR